MARFGSGDLNKRISVIRETKAFNGIETISTGDVEFSKHWAKVKWVSDGERFSANALHQSIDLRFTIRTAPIELTDKIRYNGKDYDVVAYKPLDDFFSEITCAATPRKT